MTEENGTAPKRRSSPRRTRTSPDNASQPNSAANADAGAATANAELPLVRRLSQFKWPHHFAGRAAIIGLLAAGAILVFAAIGSTAFLLFRALHTSPTCGQDFEGIEISAPTKIYMPYNNEVKDILKAGDFVHALKSQDGRFYFLVSDGKIVGFWPANPTDDPPIAIRGPGGTINCGAAASRIAARLRECIEDRNSCAAALTTECPTPIADPPKVQSGRMGPDR